MTRHEGSAAVAIQAKDGASSWIYFPARWFVEAVNTNESGSKSAATKRFAYHRPLKVSVCFTAN